MTKTQKDTQLLIITRKYQLMKPELTERTRRLWAAVEAQPLGVGGITLVRRATGLDYKTIAHGLAELADPSLIPAPGRIRHTGGGRKKLTLQDPALGSDLDRLVDPQIGR